MQNHTGSQSGTAGKITAFSYLCPVFQPPKLILIFAPKALLLFQAGISPSALPPKLSFPRQGCLLLQACRDLGTQQRSAPWAVPEPGAMRSWSEEGGAQGLPAPELTPGKAAGGAECPSSAGWRHRVQRNPPGRSQGEAEEASHNASSQLLAISGSGKP